MKLGGDERVMLTRKSLNIALFTVFGPPDCHFDYSKPAPVWRGTRAGSV